MTILSALKTATKSQKELERWERRAKPVFRTVYEGQMSRVSKAIGRASPETVQQFLAEQFRKEPALVKQAVILFYDNMARMVGEDALDDFALTASFDEINEALFRLSNERAGLFARAMTETSVRQSQVIVQDWLQTEGSTVGQLRARMRGVWTGPRPDVAATTETTFMASESKAVAWEAADVWGYNVHTMNDDLVRESHDEVADNGPYPMSDTQHRPPINGDPNCRCFISPEREAPA